MPEIFTVSRQVRASIRRLIPDKRQIQLLLFWPTLVVGQKRNDSHFDNAVQSAQEALAHHDASAAIAAYRQAASLSPETPEIYANLGILENETGRYDEAAKDLQTAVRLKPSLYSAQLFLGLSYLHLDRPKDAVSPLVLAVRLNASDTHAQFALGRAYTSLSEWQKATEVYRNAVAEAPQNSSAWFALGISYLRQVEDDSRTLSDIQSPASYRKVLFADSLAEQHRYVEAENLYREAEQETPTPPCIRSAEGLVLLRIEEVHNFRLLRVQFRFHLILSDCR